MDFQLADQLPKNCPEELAHQLEAVLSYRETNSAEIWGKLREWVNENYEVREKVRAE